MKYLLFMDVQPSVAEALPGGRGTARRIADCALAVKGRDDIFTYATRLASAGGHADAPGLGLCGCLGSLVRARPLRHEMLTTFPSLGYQIHLDGSAPEEFAVCGFRTGGMVLWAAAFLKAAHPSVKVAVIEDLCRDRSEEAHAEALRNARDFGIEVETSAANLGLSASHATEGGADAEG